MTPVLTPTPALFARDLHKSFGFTQALRGASITLDEGELVAVMGPSGSGKSTLLHCLAGILIPDSGEGLGLATSYAVARLNAMPWSPPDLGVVAIIGTGVLAALALSTLALPLLEATTRPNAIRYE